KALHSARDSRLGSTPCRRGRWIGFTPDRGRRADRRRCRRAPLALQAALDAHRALVIMVVQDLAVQARYALIGVDVALGMDRLDRAFLEAAHARVAAFAIALEPVEHADAPRDRQRRAERAQVAAEEALDEKPCHQQRER